VDEILIPGREEDRNLVKQFAAHYDAPAYVRRARQVQEALDVLLNQCRRQRDEWLGLTRIRLALLRALAGEWDMLLPLLEDGGQLAALRQLEADLAPQLRHRVEPTTSMRTLRRALVELCESIELFNRRWQNFLPTVDLSRVNALRDGYNRYYVLEKECALRSPRLARQGFRRLEPFTLEDLGQLLPPLPAPLLRGFASAP
jgi:hypothetical protein